MKGVILPEENWYYILDLLENRRDEVLDYAEHGSTEFDMASSCIKEILAALIKSFEKPFQEV